MFGLKAFDIELIQNTLCQYKEVEEVIIYGSRAMENEKPGSET